jgi:TonB family protein
MHTKLFFLMIFIFSFGAANTSAQSETTRPKIISGGVVNGKAVSLPKPTYPPAAVAVRAEGSVNVQVTIDEEGNVIAAAAVSGHPLLRAAAVEAAKQAKFSPTLLSGEAVKVSGVIVYNFVPVTAAKNNEERLIIMGLGAVLTMLRIEEFSEDEELTQLLPDELGKLAKELEPIKTVKILSPQDRARTLDKVREAVKVKLSGPEATEFEIGRILGEIGVEFSKKEADQTYQINEAALKSNLQSIKSLIGSVAADFPNEVLSQLSLLADLSEKPELTSADNLTTLGFRMMRIIEAVSPDTFK